MRVYFKGLSFTESISCIGKPGVYFIGKQKFDRHSSPTPYHPGGRKHSLVRSVELGQALHQSRGRNYFTRMNVDERIFSNRAVQRCGAVFVLHRRRPPHSGTEVLFA